ncbi:hybrid sensor histidine kinase/response regulator [Desulfurispira natronophila]|uniref:histidine kinase n=1 Tax=Desulfurispira natronophila TaxID=682562 RepID=A0A7W8DHQ1_9BACT|nr:hybrid sensor histidine kinase/response regulator [Desulfurispira natronophila]MBB5022592.1 C4-dicarboxylate-specific signal transduction histidine kinase [Desulfurispira natronophila]
MTTAQDIYSMHILLVDDSAYNIALIETALLEEGYRNISSVTSARAAYDFLHTTTVAVNLIILDILMPEIDGLEVCQTLSAHQQYQEIPILIATSRTDVETLKAAFELGASDYVRKPIVNNTELLVRVRNLLQMRLQWLLRTRREQELEELNNSLEQRIQNEVEMNRQKDQLMLHQARLAEMGEMIGYIAHQWRQPLNIVALLCQEHHEYFQANNLTAEDMATGTEKILEQLEFMSQTIDDFRNFFRSDKNRSIFPVRQALETTLSLVGAALKKNKIPVEIVYNAEPSIDGYAKEYAQVLLNIINNARDAVINSEQQTDPGIFIEVLQENGTVTVCIEDNGGGIPASIIEKIYLPYFTTKNNGQGTGLGLYMSKVIIERNMGGKLSVCNTKRGARFCITVPSAS